MIAGAASCAVAVQYVMKLLVDAMAGPREGNAAAWLALSYFIGLIAFESLLWRLSGWLGCRTTVGVGVEVRLDLFKYLNGQPMRYFPIGAKGEVHVPLRVVEDLLAGTAVELWIAAPAGLAGTVIVDLGLVEI